MSGNKRGVQEKLQAVQGSDGVLAFSYLSPAAFFSFLAAFFSFGDSRGCFFTSLLLFFSLLKIFPIE